MNWEQITAELDELLFFDPELTLCRVSEALDKSPPAEATAELLGISGTALRRMIRLLEAKDDIEAGIAVAEAIGALSILAGNYLRLAYVVADQKDFTGAMEITAEATCLYETLSDAAGVGRCLVERGRWLNKLGCDRLAILSYRRAFNLLPTDDQRNKFTAYQSLAISYLEVADLPEALKATAKAKALAGVCGAASFAAIHWLDGRILFAIGRPSKAAEPYSKALNFYLSEGAYPGQGVLVGVELVTAQFFAGYLQAAAFTANRLLDVIGVFNENEIVCDALLRLIQCETLSAELVATTWERVLRELEPSSRKWRQLAKARFSR